LVALWVMVKLSEKTPPDVGEKLITMDLDFPGPRLKSPPPLITENGPESVPTLPSKVPVDVDRFVIVRVWLTEAPTGVFPKFTGEGPTDRLTAGIAVPFKDTPVGLL